MAGVIALGVLAVCFQGKYLVQGTPGYFEPLNLYIMLIAPPGERKSSVMREMTQCLYDYEQGLNQRLLPGIRQNQFQRASLQRRIEGLESKLKHKPNREEELELQSLQEELENLPEQKPVRFFADDCTSEALTNLLSGNHGIFSVISTEGGIFDSAKPGALCIDMTTSSPSLAKELYETGKQRGVRVMDAPVSGGDSGARNATLSIMVGGDEADFAEAMPLFECMGKNIILMGPAGSGQHTKAANQIAVAGATAAYTEALLYAEKAGLDPQKMLAAIGAGAAGSWQLANMAPRALAGDFAPGFFVKHFIKDMKIVKEESEKAGVELEMLNAVLGLYEQMAAAGMENAGTQALIDYYHKREK